LFQSSRGRILNKIWHKGEPKAGSKQCEVADESVVVMKSRPVKAGNSLEGKTGTTRRKRRRGPLCAKSHGGMRREEVYSKVSSKLLRWLRRTQAARRGGTRYQRSVVKDPLPIMVVHRSSRETLS